MKKNISLPQPQLTEFWADLQQQVNGSIKTDMYSRVLYSTDASIYKILPLGVFFPKHSDEVQAAIEVAAKHTVPVLMRGAGSSLAGQAVNKALVIDNSRHLNQIIDVNASEKWVTVQPGVVLDDLNSYLKSIDLQFGPDPASSNRATLGGIVSNNSTGAHSIVYGMTADHVLKMSVVLSDGTATTLQALEQNQLSYFQQKAGFEGKLYQTLPHILSQNKTAILNGTPHHWRRCGGYNLERLLDSINLAKLVCGAEGTLAAICDITLNLVDRPKFTALGIIHFAKIKAALETVPQLLETDPSAVELMDNLGLTMCRQVPEYARLLTFLEGNPDTILITEYSGNTQAEVTDKLNKLESFLQQRNIGFACVRAETESQQLNVWTVRKVGLGLLMSVKGDYKPIPFIEDAAVPVEHLAEYISRIEDFCHQLGVKVAYYAHVSAGCLHTRPLINLKKADQAKKMEAIAAASAALVAEYGGAFSSEHGDGRARSWLNEQFFGVDLYAAFKEVKTLFDPTNIFNPDIIVNPQPMSENLRYGANYKVIPLKEQLDFKADRGFHRAVEMCNGAGVCRKGSGTMCPSYMATQDEEHSTRGRANLLRAALSGDLPLEELTSSRMYEAMDLCVECKACKAECPSSVDMTKLKTEFLAHYYTVHRFPLRSQVFANIATLSRLSSGIMAPIANWFLQNPLSRQAIGRILGLDTRRQLPTFASVPFTTWFKKRRSHSTINSSAKTVVLFNDTFNTYNHPEVAIAATEVLESLGFRVILPGHGCCGRPMISKGLVTQAKATATQTVTKLIPYVNENIPIIGLEPSCISALKDDYRYVLPNNPKVERVASATVSFEEFIVSLIDNPAINLSFSTPVQNILLHGHCHQKALVGTEASKTMLSLLPNCQIIEVDSGCCGMAGSFGYEAEHYNISITMAERQLLPAVRASVEDCTVVASGVSCRHQIKDGTGIQALHPAEVLRAAIN